MAITPNQQAIINSIVNKDTTDYDYCGSTFLNGASAATASNLEREGLEKIADKSKVGSDNKVIKAIAEWTLAQESPQSLDKKIFLFILGHRSGYGKDLRGSNEICITNNSYFMPIVQNSGIARQALPLGAKLNEQYNCYCEIDDGIYYVGENDKLFGKIKPFGFAYSTSTAACIYGSNMSAPISYEGYCFETMHGREGYATGGSIERGQFFYLTPGGGPLAADNWIIKYVQYGTRAIDESDIYTNENSSWVYKQGDSLRVIVKIWIHLFFPDGSYVRTVLDRSDSADFTDVSSNMATCWIYKDYANSIARQTGKTFANIWNSYIFNKAYRNVGGDNPGIVDVSFEWNGKHDVELQNAQTAFQYGTHTIWNGSRQRQEG